MANRVVKARRVSEIVCINRKLLTITQYPWEPKITSFYVMLKRGWGEGVGPCRTHDLNKYIYITRFSVYIYIVSARSLEVSLGSFAFCIAKPYSLPRYMDDNGIVIMRYMLCMFAHASHTSAWETIWDTVIHYSTQRQWERRHNNSSGHHISRPHWNLGAVLTSRSITAY